MFSNLDGLLWLLLLTAPLLVLQRSLHREIQAILLIVFRRKDISLALFSLMFLPGVMLHEISHFLMARLLQVRTGRFSILPRPTEDGRLQLGFVETAPADLVRDTLIGAAPLIFGGMFVAYAGLSRMGLNKLWDGLLVGCCAAFINELSALPRIPDFWLWFYMTFAVSSTMLPSASDRRAWLPLTMVITTLLAIGIIAGVGPWLYQHVAPALNEAFRALSAVFGISVLVHVTMIIPLFLVRRLLSRLFGLDVV